MRGYIYTLEVLVAIAVITLSMVFLFEPAPIKPSIETSIIKQQAFDALEYLDNKDTLRKSGNQEIANQLRPLLPDSINFSVGYSSTIPEKTVIVVDYYLGSYKGEYLGRKISLFLWEEI